MDGCEVLDVDPGAATNRTVVTVVGDPEAVLEGVFLGIQKAAELIDMRTHSGEHPRMGATDVCPFVPVSGISMEECVELARRMGQRIGEELGIPVYLYEHAASRPERVNLADVRVGEYEALATKLKKPEWKPDFGPAEFNARSGATAVSAREFLLAYNVNLNTQDKKLASDIALDLREQGRAKRDAAGEIVRDENGVAIKVPGRFKHVKGVGWYIDEYKIAQISMNLTNYKVSSLHQVFDACCEEATKRGMRVTGSEVVGLVPLEPMLTAGKYYLRKQGKSAGIPEPEIIECAVRSMGMRDVAEFDPDGQDHRVPPGRGKERPARHDPHRLRTRTLQRVSRPWWRQCGGVGWKPGRGTHRDGGQPHRGPQDPGRRLGRDERHRGSRPTP